jgi:CheY-like chemotaxis protein
MGGRIEVDSKLGIGTQFRVSLPLRLAEALPVQSAEVGAVPSGIYQVLIVDDEQMNRSSIAKLLAILGIPSRTCVSGPEGMVAIKQAIEAHQPFNMVLLDAEMPGMDGYQMANELINKNLLQADQIRILCSSAIGGERLRLLETRHGSETSQVAIGASNLSHQAHASGDLAIRGCLRKPVTLSQLRRIFVQEQTQGSVASKGFLDSALAKRRLSVLLVEDNKINQQVVIALLKKIGALYTIANNGQEAVDWVRKERFDLILMDIMMPVMDGVDAAQHIREFERQQAHLPTPIIALTAKAMKGDCEDYLRIGMNGYIAKPIVIDELFEEMEKVLPVELANTKHLDSEPYFSDFEALLNAGELGGEQEKGVAMEQEEGVDNSVIDPAKFDWDAAVSQLGGEEDLLVDLVARFIADVPDTEQRFHQRLAEQEAGLLEREAHTMKSVCATLCLNQLRQGFLALEQDCRADPMDWDRLKDDVTSLFTELADLMPYLSALVESRGSE